MIVNPDDRHALARERPILFSAPMVRAILAGKKTQTRRIVKSRSFGADLPNTTYMGLLEHTIPTTAQFDKGRVFEQIRCPYGALGDRLWVRETFARPYGDDSLFTFRAEMSDADRTDEASVRRLASPGNVVPWKPAIHMPRRASRILLEVERVRVEPLHKITAEDVYAEGVTIPVTDRDDKGRPFPAGKVKALHSITGKHPSYKYIDDPKTCSGDDVIRSHFASLWDGINGERAPWSSNPFVWVVSFKRVRP